MSRFGFWGTALTNFLWVFFGCPSGGDDRKRIFTERAGREEAPGVGGPDVGVVGGHINSMLIAAKAAKSTNVMDMQTGQKGPTTQHVEFMNGPTTVGLALMRINSQQEGGRGRARAKRMRIGRMCNKMDLWQPCLYGPGVCPS